MPQQSRPLAAALWMAGAITGFVSMAVAGRAVAPVHDTFEIMTWRSLVGIVLVLGVALPTGHGRDIRVRRIGLHFTRNLFHFTGQNLWFAALTMIPLAQLFALEFSYPILVALAAPFLLSEVLTRQKLVSALIGFGGVLIVAQPWASGGLGLGTALALMAAVGFAGSTLITKKMTRVAPMTEILFWLVVFQFCFGLILALADGKMRWPTAASLPWLVLIGIAGLGAHFCLTQALRLAPASVVAPIDFLRLPIIALVGAVFYGEPLSVALVLGGAVILLANWNNIRTENRGKRIATPQQDAT